MSLQQHANHHALGRPRRRCGHALVAVSTGLLSAMWMSGCGGNDTVPVDPTPMVDAGSPDASDGEMGPDANNGADAGPPQGFQFPDKVLAADGHSGSSFGFAVAGDGDIVVVGAPRYSRYDGGEVADAQIGAVYVYERKDGLWGEPTQLLAEGDFRETSSEFGWSMDVSGDIIAVGAWNYDEEGAVLVFERDGAGWTQTDELTLFDTSEAVRFGFDISVDGDRIAVGSPFISDIDDNEPATPAYIFTKNASSGDWDGVSLLPDINLNDPRDSWFGYSIDLSGDTLVVGAPGDKQHGPASGAAYIFEFTGGVWQQQARLYDEGGEGDDYYARDVAIEGDLIAVGSEAGGSPTQLNTGMVFAYERNGGTWDPAGKILPDDADIAQLFGFKVEIIDGRILVGAHHDDQMGTDAGAAYVFERNADGDFVQYSKLVSLEGSAGDHFGAAVCAANGTVVVGARYDDDGGNESGSVYFFEAQPTE